MSSDATAKDKAKTGRWLRLFVGIALSGAALYLALRRTSFAEIGDALADTRWQWIPAMLALKVTTLVIKDIRWRVELGAMSPGPYRSTFRAIGLGYFGNIVLPFKLGELLRVGLLKRHNSGVSAGAALASVAAERVLDGAVLALMVGPALLTVDVEPWMLWGTAVLLVAVMAIFVLAMLKPLHDFFLDRLPETGLLGVGRKIVAAASAGTAVLRQPRALFIAAALTALAWLTESAVFLCAANALAIDISFNGLLVVTLLLSIGLLIPSAPGQLGTHQALTVLFLAGFGVASGIAISVSILLQAVALATLCSIGGYVLITESAGIRSLIRRER